MRSSLGLAILAVILVGCSTPAPEPTVVSKAPDPVVTKAEPAQVKTPPTKPNSHPERIYSLADIPTVKLEVNGHPIDAWIADDDSKRSEGMMYLKTADVKDSQGMIFVFPNERPKTDNFWMHDTPIPLDIIYIAHDGKVVNIGNGVPFSEDQVVAEGPYWYVLELKRGMYKTLGIKPGSLVTIPVSLKAVE